MPDPSDSTAPVPKTPAESAPETAPAAAAGKSAPAGPPAEPLVLVPRTRSASAGPKEGSAPPGPEGPPASFTDLMQWMKMFAAATTAPPEETTKPANRPQRTVLPKEQRKFQRFDREPGAPEAAPAPAPPAAGTAPESQSADQRSVPPAFVPVPAEDNRASTPASRPVPMPLAGGMNTRRSKSAAARQPRLWLALELGALAVLAVIFLLGRASVRKAAPSPGAAPAAADSVLSPEAARMIDEAMAAEQDRKADRATELLLQVQKDFPQVRGLDFRLANLALEKGDSAEALEYLNQAIAKGEQSAAAYRLHGTILNRRAGLRKGGGGNRAMSDFENATIIDPFSADNFYYWGEALRQMGKPQAALVKLQQAMDRLREPELEAEYRLKIRTTMIELGQEKEFAPELAAMLAENPPPPDWLLTAAAIGLQHHNFADAANYLEQASHLMDKDLFNLRMRDYFFFSYRFEKPVAKYFAFAATAPPAAGRAAAPNPTPAPAPSGTP